MQMVVGQAQRASDKMLSSSCRSYFCAFLIQRFSSLFAPLSLLDWHSSVSSYRRTFFSVVLFLTHPHSQTYINTNKNNNSPSEPAGNPSVVHLFSVSEVCPSSGLEVSLRLLSYKDDMTLQNAST